MTQQEEYRLSNQPTSRTTGCSNAMIDRIVHEKFKNSSIKWGPSISIHLRINQAMTKPILPTSLQQQVPMQSLWKVLNKCSIKKLI